LSGQIWQGREASTYAAAMAATDTTATDTELDEQANAELREELLEVVRKFRDNEIIPNAAEYDATDTYPEPIVEKMKELGLFGVTVPVEFGGLGLDVLTYAMIVEELAFGWMSVSGFLNTHTMACFLIKEYGTEAQKQHFLPRLATGEIRAAYSLSEPDAGSDVASIRTRAERDGDTYVINGTKMWLTNGREAGLVVTLVKTDPEARHAGMSVMLVEKEPGPSFEGISVSSNIHKLGYRGVETVELTFTDHRIPAGNLLGGVEGQGFFQMMAAVELGRINISARAVGVARRAFEESIRYAQERQAFGKPIAHHQAIQFKLAEMGTKLHAARLVCYDAAKRKNRGERVDLDAGMAKLFCSETCWEITQEALRIHGGNGYAAEYPIERLYRDAPLMIVGEGTSEIQKMVIGRRLLEEYAI
jgi:alkylation response protein AidB-like acyl-CoA dehydrogenase